MTNNTNTVSEAEMARRARYAAKHTKTAGQKARQAARENGRYVRTNACEVCGIGSATDHCSHDAADGKHYNAICGRCIAKVG